MASSQFSTPGNSSSNFYTPQAASTRKSQSSGMGYFGTGPGSTPGYSMSAWSGGNGGNLGAGASGLNANDGPGGFTSGMNGTWQEPGYQNNFTYQSVGTPSAGGFGGGTSGGAIAGAPTGGPGSPTDSTIQSGQYSVHPTNGFQGNGYGNFWDNYGQNAQDQYAARQQMGAYQQQMSAQYQTDAQNRQQAQHQAFLNSNPNWLSPDQVNANRQNNDAMRAAEDQLLTQYGSGGIPNNVHQQMLSQFGMGAGQSQLGAAMDSGTGAMPTAQQMAAFGNGPAATGVQAQPQSRYEQMAINPQRMSTLPISQLQNIANNDTTRTSLRGPIADESARLARMELANRGAAGNQVAAGNMQASDPIEQRLNEMRGTGPFAPDFLDMVTPENIIQAALQGLPNGGYGGGNELVQSGTGGMTMAPGGGFQQGSSGQQFPMTRPMEQFPNGQNPNYSGGGNGFADKGFNFPPQSTGAYGLGNAIGGGYGAGAGMNLPPGMGDTLGPSSGTLPNGQPYVLGPSHIPLDPATMQPVLPMQPSPSGKPQNPFEKLPGYVNPQPASQPQPTRTGRPIWGSQPNPYEQPGSAAPQSIPGIEGSMAIGPDGKPYGGTPNLSRPDPGGNNLPQNPNGQQSQSNTGFTSGHQAEYDRVKTAIADLSRRLSGAVGRSGGVSNSEMSQLSSQLRDYRTQQQEIEKMMQTERTGWNQRNALLSQIMGNPTYN